MLKKWKEDFINRNKYAQPSRMPFFKLAGKYLPSEASAVVVDIGAGNGEFAVALSLKEKYVHHALLDLNQESVVSLKELGWNADAYSAPDSLPFKDGSVAYIHLSHIVEHLPHESLYRFLKEIDRVLGEHGVLVISTPLLWERFYDDLSHVKPYNPQVFTNYLTRNKDNATQISVSNKYQVRELEYRYRDLSNREWGSRYFAFDALLRTLHILRSMMGFRKYVKNGYTLILQKIAQ